MKVKYVIRQCSFKCQCWNEQLLVQQNCFYLARGSAIQPLEWKLKSPSKEISNFGRNQEDEPVDGKFSGTSKSISLVPSKNKIGGTRTKRGKSKRTYCKR